MRQTKTPKEDGFDGESYTDIQITKKRAFMIIKKTATPIFENFEVLEKVKYHLSVHKNFVVTKLKGCRVSKGFRGEKIGNMAHRTERRFQVLEKQKSIKFQKLFFAPGNW